MTLSRWHLVGLLAAIGLFFAMRGRDFSPLQYRIAIVGSILTLGLLPFAARRLFKTASPAKKTDIIGYAVIVIAAVVVVSAIDHAL